MIGNENHERCNMNKRYCNGMVHVIKQGETLYQLSRRYRVPLALILRANPYVDVYNLQVGQEICIPVVRPFNGMVCMPIQQRNDGNPRMMDNRQQQMPDGNEQEMEGERQAEMEGMPPQTMQQMAPQTMQQMPQQTMQGERNQGGMDQQMPPQMPQSGMAPPSDMSAQSSQPWPEESPCPCQSEADVYEQDEDHREDDDDEVEVYITSGNRSLGDILNEYDVDLDDFAEKNDLSQISICEDVVLYLPKKHNNSRG